MTGGAGFIGSHLSEALLQAGHRVTVFDNFDPFYPRALKEYNLRSLQAHQHFSLVEGDLRDPETVADLWRKHGPFDMVVHLAAKAGVLPSIQDPAGYTATNIRGTQHLLEQMVLHGPHKLVFASSSSVYGDSTPTPFSETAPCNQPISPYAFTKRACEFQNYTYHHLHGIDVLNLRFFTVFGPRQRPDLAINKFVRLARAGEPIPMYGDGSTARDYTYVGDTVQGVLAAITYLQQHSRVFETVNLGNHTPVKLIDLIHTVFEVLEVSGEINQLPMQPGDVKITYADIQKAQALLGYQPRTSFRQGLQQFIAWQDEARQQV